MPKASLSRFNQILADCANRLLARVREEIKNKKWRSAMYHARGGPDTDSSGPSKLRVVLQDGTLKGMFAPGRVAGLLGELWEMKPKLFPKPWYGIKITFYPDGKFDTEYDYGARPPADFFKT